MLTPEQLKQAVEEFKAIFLKQFGRELSDEEATEGAKLLLNSLALELLPWVPLHIAKR